MSVPVALECLAAVNHHQTWNPSQEHEQDHCLCPEVALQSGTDTYFIHTLVIKKINERHKLNNK